MKSGEEGTRSRLENARKWALLELFPFDNLQNYNQGKFWRVAVLAP